jgi:tripartite-type tricarboxylate transporter receptor subunit TctC
MAMDEPESQNVLEKFNLTPLYLNSEDCARSVYKDIEPIGKLLQKLGLQKK